MRREKRTAQVRANLTPSLFEEFREIVDEEGGQLLSMSDFLYSMIEDRVVEKRAKKAIRVSKQNIARRVGES